MGKYTYGGIFFALLFSINAWAFSGSLKSSTDFYQQKLGPPTEQTTPFGQLELAHKHKFSKRLRLQLKFFALGNFESEKPAKNQETLANEQTYLDLPEAFFELKNGASKFRFGLNTVNWGLVDVSSPSNVVNTSAFLHPLRMPRRGSPMVEWQWDKETFGFSVLYIPKQPRPVLPATNSRWLPRDVLTNFPTGISTTELGTVKLPSELNYYYLPDRELDHARDHNYGLKIHSHLGSWDLQATYFEGASPFPKAGPGQINISSPNGYFEAGPDIGLRQILYRVRHSGFGLTYAADAMIFRLETVYQHTISKGNGLQPWSWSNVAGVETNIDLGSSSLTILAQYYHTDIPTKADNLISSSYRLFDRTGVLGLRWPVSDSWTLSSSALLETQTHGLFWQAAIEHKISDALKMSGAWRDFSAQEQGLIKTFEKNDHAALDLTYFF